jgi:hypothetical protein
LEAAYQDAWSKVPKRWRDEIQAASRKDSR